MTAEIVDRAKAAGREREKAIVKKLAHELPAFASLDAATQERIGKLVAIDEYKDIVKAAADLEKVDYRSERSRFLATKGYNVARRSGSERTKVLYTVALGKLEAWCQVKGISPLELTPGLADDWIASERGSANTVRLAVSGCSAFWTWLERRHDHLRGKNPFRGTKARPQRKAARKLEVPTDTEIDAILQAAEPWLPAAVSVMANIGLRVGGLQGLSITGSRWTTVSKGKDHGGAVPDSVRQAVTKAGLPLRSPFAEYGTRKISKAFDYRVKKRHPAGAVKALYSVHHLRHAFAVRLYRATRDIYSVKRALGHASVSVTEMYLRSLDEEI
jgi:site-specific recombinase XerD